MATSGAQPGNDNARKGKEFNAALRNALAHKSGKGTTEGLKKVAIKLVEAAFNGEQWAIKEVADRFDGKPAQAHIGDEEQPIHHKHDVTTILLQALKK